MMICFVAWPLQAKAESNPENFKYVINEDGESVTVTGYEGDETGDFVIPDTLGGLPVTIIGDEAFADMSNFKGSLTIPDSVTTIGQGAFYSCKGFTGLKIGNSVTTIGQDAFYDCEGFTGELTIPNSVTTIGKGAFYLCKGFTGDLIIPASVTSIGSYVFYNTSFNSISVPFPNKDCMINDPNWNNDVFYGCNAEIIYCGEYVISFDPNKDNIIGSMENKKTENKKIKLPECGFISKGYKFVGWSYEADGEKIEESEIDIDNETKNITLYALWEKLPVYKITFAGGSGATGTAPAALSGNEKDKVTLPKNTFTKKGYKFVGWTDGSKTYKAGASYTIPAKNVKFTAKWQKNEPTKRELIEQFAERMYTKALGRSAEPDGLKYWADRLEKQIDDGANMAYGFITSEEFKS